MYFNGSFTLKGAGADVVFISPTGETIKYAIQLEFRTTNNVAEYEGLVIGLRIAEGLGIRRLLIRGDSQLVAKQVQKEYNCNNERMANYLAEVQKMEKHFDGFEVRHVPRLDNRDADHLAWIASSRSPVPEDVVLEKMLVPSTAAPHKGLELPEEPIVMVIDGPDGVQDEGDWRLPIQSYLECDLPPDDSAEAQRMAHKARVYVLMDDELYKKGHNGMLMKCILIFVGQDLLRKIHGGICGAHNSVRTLIGKAFRHGFYWPTAKQDAIEIVRTYEHCQLFQKQTTMHAEPLHTIPLSWPFTIWGIDILGPFPVAAGGYKSLFVGIDTFTKWIEAEAIRNISHDVAFKFLRSIVYRFGVPSRVITDNGTQFTRQKWKKFFAEHENKHMVSSASHP